MRITMTLMHDEEQAIHPAAEWAGQQTFNATQVDCTTAVVLKILDNKCKMLPGEKAAVVEVYSVVKEQPGELFGSEVHRTIARALEGMDETLATAIHALRVEAEARIPKPVMKAYKAVLRDGLFG